MVDRDKNIKQLVPLEYIENILARFEKMTKVCVDGWREDAAQMAAAIPVIPPDQVELNNRLVQADRMERVLQQLQDCYPQFCQRGDCGGWIAYGLGQIKEPMYPTKESIVETLQDENQRLAMKNRALEISIQAHLKEKDDLVAQLCDFDSRWEDVRRLVGAVAGREVECLANTLNAYDIEQEFNQQLKEERYELRKELDAIRKELLEVKSNVPTGPKE